MINPFKPKESRTTTVGPEGEVPPQVPDERTLRKQQIEAYSDPLTDMYTEKRNHMRACIQEFEKTLAKRNEVYVKLMDGKKYIPDIPNIRAYFEDLDKRFKELTTSLEELRLSCIDAIEDGKELFKRLEQMDYKYIDGNMVTKKQYDLKIETIDPQFRFSFETDHIRWVEYINKKQKYFENFI